MRKTTFLFFVLAALGLGQQFTAMPEPMPQVEYVGGLPSWVVEIYQTKDGLVPEVPHKSFASGSQPPAHMIILQTAPESEARLQPQPQEQPVPKWYLEKSIWADLAKMFQNKGFPDPLNRVDIETTSKAIARCNNVEVKIWNLRGIIRDTKMPKGYPVYLCAP